ncbi:MAG: DUF1559 domain-containing protein [Planctomycetaceae bacterium]|jgi:hypothetical protein|nr:DUF1559 domain-containing protein [Planctomycetaceae bacterium]
MYPDPNLHSSPTDAGPRRPDRQTAATLRAQNPLLFWILILMTGAGLLTLIVPAIQNARIAARQSKSNCSLKQNGMAAYNYYDVKGGLPTHSLTDPAGTPLHSWCTELLPFLDAESLYRSIDFSKAWSHPDNTAYFREPARAKLLALLNHWRPF